MSCTASSVLQNSTKTIFLNLIFYRLRCGRVSYARLDLAKSARALDDICDDDEGGGGGGGDERRTSDVDHMGK